MRPAPLPLLPLVPLVPLVRSVVTCALLLLTLCADYVWGALYHGAHPPLVVAGVIAAYGALLYALAWSACRWIARLPTVWLLDFASLLMAAYLALSIVRRLVPGGAAMPLALKLILVAAALAGAACLLMKMGTALRARLAHALIGASLLFLLTPPLVAALAAPARVFPLAPAGAGPTPPNVVVLLLDELGDEAAQPVVDALQQRGMGVARTALTPLGANTVNVIPAMLTGADFSAAQACSLSAICSGKEILDFARMRSAEPQLDIVGFHHPYCKMAGLRSCYQAQTPGIDNPFLWFGCVVLKAVARSEPDACAWGLLSVPQVNAVRAALLDAVARAPFWQAGGVLYVHHPLPHPPGRGGAASLDADYAANLADAALLVDALAARLERSFGRHYALVISSDHPLRPAVWCAMARYAASGCALRPAFRSQRIPLLLATPGPAPSLGGETGVFRLVDRLRAGGAAP